MRGFEFVVVWCSFASIFLNSVSNRSRADVKEKSPRYSSKWTLGCNMSIQWLDADMKELNPSKLVEKLHSAENDISESSGNDESYHPDCDNSSSSEEDLESESESLDSLIEDSKRETEGKTEGKVGHSDGKSKRQKKPCPLPTCNSVVLHIPRHLEEVHGWAKEHSRTALARFGLRKNYTYSDSSKVPKKKKKTNPEVDDKKKKEGKRPRDYHHYRYCPLPGCTSLVKRLPPHLKKVHQLIPGSKDYKEAMSKVRGHVRDTYRKPYHERPRSSRCDDHPLECSFPSIRVEVISSDEETNDDYEESAETPDNGMPYELRGFETWLQSADGGKLDQKTSQQHTKQVFKLLHTIDEKHEVLSLFDERLINDRFLEDHAKNKYTPKTTQSYLMSLRHFYSFTLAGVVGVSVSKEKIISLKDKVARWSSSYRVESFKRRWEKMTQDFQALITPQQISEFERSKASRDAISLLGQLAGAHNIVLTQTQYTLIRDFLLVEISIDNANRAGSLANITLGEFTSMSKQNDDYVALVMKSKTLSTHGPARIVFSSKLKSWLDIFVREVRSQVTGSSNSPDSCLFLSFNGEPMASSQINKGIKSIWKKADLEGALSSTLFRKSAVSTMHSSNDSNKAHGNLADLMAHNLSTAKKYYRLQEKSKSSVLAAKQLRQVMRLNDDDESSSSKSPFPRETPKQQKQKDPEDNLVAAGAEDCQSKTSKVSWSPGKENLVRALFQEEIDQRSISIEAVRSKISNHPDLQNENPKRVLDKVRTLWRYETDTPAEPLDLPSEQETLEQRVQRALEDQDNTSEIIPPTVTKSMKNVFVSNDLENIRNTFKDMILKSTPIFKTKVKEILEKESWGRRILEKVSVDTVVNRIKYERRMRRGKLTG